MTTTRTLVLPNGCEPPASPSRRAIELGDIPDEPYAILVGQINERIDIDVLLAISKRMKKLVAIGPITAREPGATTKLDELLDSPFVTWLGPRGFSELGPYLAAATVGITPYQQNEFNRASFPLKTLEYLAAGLPVIATDLPATRWLDTELIQIAHSPEHFALLVERALDSPEDGAEIASRRREFAAKHGWDVRARTLLANV